MVNRALLTAPSTDEPAMETTLEIENQKKKKILIKNAGVPDRVDQGSW